MQKAHPPQAEVRNEMQSIANQIAVQRTLPGNDYRALRAPGQAASCFLRLYAADGRAREDRDHAGAKFDRLKFDDFVIGQRLLPPDLLDKAVEREFIPSLQ